MPSITFLGAARTVTGSKYLLDTGSAKVLIDAGLFQGLKELRERNWQNLPIAASAIDAIVLTHAHLDHCGYLPRLVSQGFRGRVFCTAGTQDLCRIVLPDSGRIQEEDAANANRHGFSKHKPALPLYGEADAFRAVSQLQPVGYDRPMPVATDVEVEFINAGHLLGSAYARVRTGGRTILFGGDLGRFNRPVLPDPTMMAEADYLLVESTYGNRVHVRRRRRIAAGRGDQQHRRARRPRDRSGLRDRPRRGADLLAQAARGTEAHPGAAGVRRQPDGDRGAGALHRADARARSRDAAGSARRESAARPGGPSTIRRESAGGMRGTNARSAGSAPSGSARSRRRTSREQLTQSKMPAIVISASGMATGGRVLHHLKAAPARRAQHGPLRRVPGGRHPGASARRRTRRPSRSTARSIPVHATIGLVESMSAHADSNEILHWLGGFTKPPRTTFIVHGEQVAMDALSATIAAKLGWTTKMPQHGETVQLE